MSRYDRDFDLVDVVVTWAADGELPKAMRAFLADAHQENLDEPPGFPSIAPASICADMELPQGSTWPEVVASLLDATSGRATWEHLREVQIAMGIDEEEAGR